MQQEQPELMAKFEYLSKLDTDKYDPVLRENLVNLMNMGFTDFKKNMNLLKKFNNNLNLVCS